MANGTALSESELLFLDTLIYCSVTETENISVGEIIDGFANGTYSAEQYAMEGAMEPEQFMEVIESVASHDTLRSYEIVQATGEDGIRAACFRNAQSGDTVVAYRGTGGTYDAWADNVEGGNTVETEMQKAAARFIRNDCGAYQDITVTGHSKGGNLSQYVTVTCGDQIDACVSFDGQGFSPEFMDAYAKEIHANAGKIKSICGDSDYVNILLFSIAARTVYLPVDTEGNGIVKAHRSYDLYMQNINRCVGEVYTNTVGQDPWIARLGQVLDRTVSGLELLELQGLGLAESAIYTTVATIVGFVFDKAAREELWNNLQDPAWLISMLRAGYEKQADWIAERWNKLCQRIQGSRGNVRFYIQTIALRQASGDLGRFEKTLRNQLEELQDVKRALDATMPTKATRSIAINRAIRRLNGHADDLKGLANAAIDAALLYENSERAVAAHISAAVSGITQ